MKHFLICCLMLLAGMHLQAQNKITKSRFMCDVTQNGIFYLSIEGEDNLKFYTMPTLASGGPNSFTYEWTFTYQDLTTSGSTDREPFIPVPCSNPIVHVYVKVSSATCFKEFNKDYPVPVCGTGSPSVKANTKK